MSTTLETPERFPGFDCYIEALRREVFPQSTVKHFSVFRMCELGRKFCEAVAAALLARRPVNIVAWHDAKKMRYVDLPVIEELHRNGDWVSLRLLGDPPVVFGGLSPVWHKAQGLAR